MSLHAQRQDEAITLENKLFVFQEANYSSDTIYTIQKNQIFWLLENEDDSSSWVQIEITQNSLSRTPANNMDFYITGFVPKSKIYHIDSLPKYKTNDIILKFKVVKADRSQVIAENNLRYGLEIPLSMSYVVNEMFLDWKGIAIRQDPEFFNDLYNVSFKEGVYSNMQNERFSIYRLDDFYFIKQECGDGAGSYQITWVIRDGSIIQRMVDEI